VENMSLLRKASFGRHRTAMASRAQAPEAEAEVEAQADAEGPKKGIGRLLRSASFERRRRGKQTDTGTNGAPGATDESEGSSTLSERTPTTPTDDGEMRGWLLKRHSRGKSAEVLQWAHRFFSVDDVRGTLSYSKAETFSYGKNPAVKKPSAILPLADISQVVALEGKDIGATDGATASSLCFLISCPPVHLTVCAKDVKTRDFWLNGLQARAAKWREKLGPMAVAVSPKLGPSVASPSPPPLPNNCHPMEESSESLGPSVDDRHEAVIEGRLARAGEGWRAPAAASPDERPEAPPAAARPGSAAPREGLSTPHGGRPQSASTPREGRHVRAARLRQEAARTRSNPVAPPPLPPGYGTEELHSDEEEEDVGEAQEQARIGVPGLGGLAEMRDLADMLSSDEEDEDAPPRGPRSPMATSRSSYVAARLPTPPAYEADEAHEEHEGAQERLHGGSSACVCASAPSHSRAFGRGAAVAAGAGAAGAAGSCNSTRAALADRFSLPPLPSAEEARADPMAWLSAMPDSAYGASLYNDDAGLDLDLDLHESAAPGARQPRHAELLDQHFEALATPFETQGEPPADAPQSTRRSRRTAQTDPPVRQEESLYGPPASPPPPLLEDEFHEYDDVHGSSAVVVGAGFHADPDFVNELWDSDDEH